MQQEKSIVATSKSKHVLDAFYKYLLDQGFQEDSKWNKQYTIDYILLSGTPYLHIEEKSKNLVFHNHDCSPSTVYNLPEQWNEAIEAFTKIKNTKEVSEESIKKSGLKIGDRIFQNLSYHCSQWTDKEWGVGNGFGDHGGYKISSFEVYTDCAGTSKECAVVNSTGTYRQEIKYYFPLEQFKERVEFKSYSAQVEGNTIAFGCQKFTKEEILAYKKLLNKEIGATIKIGNKEVTVEILEKLIKKLKNK